MDPRFSSPPDPSTSEAQPQRFPAPIVSAPEDEASGSRGPSLWNLFLALVCALVLSGILVVVVIGASGFRIRPPIDRVHFLSGLIDRPVVLLSLLAVTPLCMGIVALAAAAFSHVPWRKRLGLERGILRVADYPVILLGDAGAFMVSVALMAALVKLHWVPPPGEDRLGLVEMFHHVPPSLRWSMLLVTSLITGIGEELMFRGYVQRGLLDRWRPAWAIGVASVAFTIFHGDVAYSTFILPGAIYLGYIAWRSQSILPAIACHVLENGVVQAAQMFMGSRATSSSAPISAADWWIGSLVLVLAIGAVVISVRWIEALHHRTTPVAALQVGSIDAPDPPVGDS